MKHYAIGQYCFDPDADDVKTCAVCGEKWDDIDMRKVGDGYLCPVCFKEKFDKWNKLSSLEMDEYDIEIMKWLLG